MNPHSTRVVEAFDRAKKLYTRCLTAEERSRIHEVEKLSTLVAVTKRLADEVQSAGNQKVSLALQNVGRKAISLEPLEKLVEGAAKLNHVAGDMIWGSISFVLEMVKNNAKAFDQVLGFFENFADEVGYIDLQNQTYVSSSLVQSVMAGLYVAILNFWVAAVTYYRAMTGGLRGRIKTFVTASAIQKGFEAMKAEIITQRTRLHDATSAEHNAETSSFHANINSFQHTIRQRELKKWLNAPNYAFDLRTATELRYPETCKWILGKQPYIDFVMSSSLFLYIHGIPGSGKTVLSSWIINDMQTTHGAELLLYHYFKGTDANKRTPQSAVRSFLDQLHNHLRNTQNSLLSQLESDMEKASIDRSGHVDYADLWDLFLPLMAALASSLSQQSPTSQTIIFIMDAMDECQLPTSLVSDLLNLAQAHPDQIRILVTGRKSALDMLQDSLSSSVSSLDNLEITTEDVHDDIQAYVRHTVRNVPRLKNHQVLRDRLVETIGSQSNHQGMFLWAYFMCEEVRRQGDPLALQKLLDHLPRGLDAMYVRICDGIIEKDDGLGFSLSVLQWLVHSPRPMTFPELQDGLKMMRSSTTSASFDDWFDETSDLLWSCQDIVDTCGNLVTYDGDSFRLVHLSATQFFRGHFGRANGPGSPETIRQFIENIKNAELELASLCLQYLLAPKLNSHKYLTLLANYRSFPSSKREDFLLQFPLFLFTVIYWPDLVLGGLSAKGGSVVVPSSLTHAITSFDSSTAITVWFVHAANHLSVEAITDSLEQSVKAGLENPNSGVMSIIAWARKWVDILTDYGQALSDWPELVRRCWPMDTIACDTPILARTWQTKNAVLAGANTAQHLSLAHNNYQWIHYDPQKDLFFGIEDQMCLRVHLMKANVPLRPGTVPYFARASRTSFFHAASVSPSSLFVAAIFTTKYDAYLVVWKLSWPSRVASSDVTLQVQPDLILCERFNVMDSQVINSYNPQCYLAFFGDDRLVTQQGIWDLKKREWCPVLPANSLYQPSDHPRVYFFSGNGTFAASTEGDANELSFFETQTGRCVSQVKFSNTKSLFPLAFSSSGQKLVLLINPLQPTKFAGGCEDVRHADRCTGFGNRIFCVIVNKNMVALNTPYHTHVHSDTQIQFSSDEETIVALVTLCDGDDIGSQEPVVIGLWKLMKDARGHYTHALFTHHFKDWSRMYKFTSFCLTPPLRNTSEMVIVASDGITKQRPLDLIWSADEEEDFMSQRPDNIKEIVKLDPKAKTFTVILLKA
ncbi:hypothetical protein H0H93_003792, partial [Arthromyces matolae]